MTRVIDLRRYGGNGGLEPTKELGNVVHGVRPFSRIDRADGRVTVTRDPLGQMPLHYLVQNGRVFVANTIKDLRWLPGYDYPSVRVIRHSTSITVSDRDREAPVEHPYFDFYDHQPRGFEMAGIGDIEHAARYVRAELDKAGAETVASSNHVACLLSGGIDSMLATYLASRVKSGLEAFTLGLSSNVEDAASARDYARAFGVEHHMVMVASEDIVDVAKEAVWRSEIYHLYNVYCAVGMVLLARELRNRGIDAAVCGEAPNEAVGDYHHWEVTQPDGSKKRIQSTDIEAFHSVRGRHAYIFGNPRAAASGLYNLQLGSGLAKHGTSRMYKPMLEYGVSLRSPYMQVDVLKVLASISPEKLAQAGGKSGFMSIVFADDIKRGLIPREFFIEKKKTRLQDANANGQGGITEVLLGSGLTQEKAIEIFNELFAANVANDERFTNVTLR